MSHTDRTTTKEKPLDNGWVKFTETIKDDTFNVTTSKRVVYAGPWEVTTTSCFCCTCEEDDYGMLTGDPVCRNHGFVGERVCDIHNLGKQQYWYDDQDETSDTPNDKPVRTVLERRDDIKNGRTYQ